jgi:hypothetical protein
MVVFSSFDFSVPSLSSTSESLTSPKCESASRAGLPPSLPRVENNRIEKDVEEKGKDRPAEDAFVC